MKIVSSWILRLNAERYETLETHSESIVSIPVQAFACELLALSTINWLEAVTLQRMIDILDMKGFPQAVNLCRWRREWSTFHLTTQQQNRKDSLFCHPPFPVDTPLLELKIRRNRVK